MTDELATAPAAPVADTSAQPAAQATGGAAPAETNPGETSNPHDAGAVGEPSADTAIAKHPYNVEEFGRLLGNDGDGAVDLHAFGGEMAAHAVPEQVVHAGLRWYEAAVGGTGTGWEGLVEAAGKNPDHLAPMLGYLASKAERNTSPPTRDEIAAARRLVDKLPDEAFEALTVPLKGGRVLGNDPAVIRWFATLARHGESHRAAAVLQAGRRGPADELSDLQAMVKDRRSAYWTGPEAERNQARMRELAADPAAQAKPMPTTSAAVEAEISRIEKRMRSDLAGYRKDEAMQRRYRELLQARGG